MTEGKLHVQISSDEYLALTNIDWASEYKWHGNSVAFSSKYKDSSRVYILSSKGRWEPEAKGFEIKLDGDIEAALLLKLTDMSLLEGTVTYNKRYIGGVALTYEPNMESSYGLGQHRLHLITRGADQNNEKEYTLVISLDPNKAKIQLDTPFEGWTHMELGGDFHFSSYQNKVTLQGTREQDKMFAAWMHNTSPRKIDPSAVEIQIKINGFDYLWQKLANKLASDMITDSEKNIIWKLEWSAKLLDCSFQTPLKNWRKFLLTLKKDFTGHPHSKYLSALVTYNEKTNEFKLWLEEKADWKIGHGQISISLHPSKLHALEWNYNVNDNYQVNLNYESPIDKYGANIYLMQEPLSAQIDLQTPIRGYEIIQWKALYQKLENGHHEGSVSWELNEKKEKLSFTLQNTPGHLNLRLETPMVDWNTMKISIDYDLEFKTPLLIIAERGDGKKIDMEVMVSTSNNWLNTAETFQAITQLRLNTPFEGFKQIWATGTYDRNPSKHGLSITFKTDKDLSKGAFNFQVNHVDEDSTKIETNLAVDSDYFNVDELKLQVVAMLNPRGKSVTTLSMTTPKVEYQVDGTIDLTPDHKRLILSTPFSVFQKIDLALEHRADKVTVLYGRYEADDKISEISEELTLLNGISESMIKLNIQTHFYNIGSVVVEASNNYSPGNIDAGLFVQTDTVRWIVRSNGTYESKSGNISCIINTPFKEYNNILSALTYSFQDNNKNLDLSISKNGHIWVGANGEIHPDKVELVLNSNVEYFNASVDGSVNWTSQPIFQLIATGKDSEMRAIFNGLGSGFFKVGTQLWKPFDLLLEWNVDGGLKKGNMNGKIYNSKSGLHSLKSAWSSEDSWKKGNLDFWMHSDAWSADKGISLQYSAKPNPASFGHLDCNCTYQWAEQSRKIRLEMSILKSSQGLYTLDGSCETPFWTDFSVNGMLNLGPVYSCKVLSKFNGTILGSLDASTSFSVLESGSTLKIHIPHVFPLFSIASTHDFRKAMDKTVNFEVEYGNYLMEAKSHVKSIKNKTQLELDLNISNRNLTMPVTLTYSIGASSTLSDDSTQTVECTINSNKTGHWSLNGSLRPKLDNLFSKLELVSALPDLVPSLAVETHWNGKISEVINSKIFVKIDTSELHAALAFGDQKLEASLDSSFPQLRSTSITGMLRDDNHVNGKSVQLKFSQEEKKYLLDGKISHEFQPEFSVTISDVSLEEINSPVMLGSVKGSLVGGGNVEVKGTWANQNVVLVGNIKSRGNQSWWKAGDAELKILVDSVEHVEIHASHVFQSGEYSFNATSGQTYSFRSYLYLQQRIVSLFALTQWGRTKTAGLNLRIEPGTFQVSIYCCCESILPVYQNYCFTVQIPNLFFTC